MLLFPLIIFAVVFGWALKEGEIYLKEGLIYGGIVVLSTAGVLLGTYYWEGRGLFFAVPIILVDIILIVKMVGNPIAW